VYLSDIDGNGLELAWDRPAHEWPWHGDQIRMLSRPLPLRILLGGPPEQDYESIFSIGHLHLQVASLKEVRAYQNHLGLRVTQSDYPGALFLARGRYHHHLAINTWRTSAPSSRPERPTGLVGWEMTRESGSMAASWRDSSGSLITLLPESGPISESGKTSPALPAISL
jgi:catechol 2,3-dioxygenase